VIEDATSGVQAAKGGAMAAIGVARLGDGEELAAAGADLVVTTLDDVSLQALGEGRLAEGGAARELRNRHAVPPPNVWMLVYDGYDPSRQGLRETLCSSGNGFFVTRGALPEATADGADYPGTYVAGLYDRAVSEVAGRQVENEDLVNLPNWLSLRFRVAGGEWFDVRHAHVEEHRYELDMRHGTLTRRLRWRDAEDRLTSVVQRWFVSRAEEHLAGLATEVTADNWSGSVEIQSGLDGRQVNGGVKRYQRLNGRHLTVLDQAEVDGETVDLEVQTLQSKVQVTLAARTRLLRNGRVDPVERTLVGEPGLIAHQLSVPLEQGQSATVEKVVALYTSRDHATSESRLDARLAVSGTGDFPDLLARHSAEWVRAWKRFDIALDTPEEWTGTILHLHIYHLLQTVSPHTSHLDVGIPARGWNGEAYRGHIFWDELFIFPFLNFQRPWIARALLQYRYARLGTARAAARRAGFEGAMFPWQSGSNGQEETQQLHLNPTSGRWLSDPTHLQRHVNIAIAYNVWQHYMITGDTVFLRFTGAELMIEIARFWASITTHNPDTDRYEINGVMGPDEYHEGSPDSAEPGLRNNAYTNVMAVWVLQRALETLAELPPHYRQEVVDQLAIRDEELDRWREISRKMTVIFHADGVLSQFEGYERLREFDWESYRERYGDIQRLDRLLEAEGDSANNYKVAKQADVLMLLFLLSRHELTDLLAELGYQVSDEQLVRTVDYYLARTSHGSTLSAVVSAWVLGRFSPEASWQFLLRALRSDVSDVQGGTTAEGIHLGGMAGTVDLVLRGMTGLRARGPVLRFDPALPPQVKRLRFSLHYRGHRVEVALDEDRLELSSLPGQAAPVTVLVRNQSVELVEGSKHVFALAGWSPGGGCPAVFAVPPSNGAPS
jgi:trehalose/maltose hydrolase-like predicted phosphorylase